MKALTFLLCLTAFIARADESKFRVIGLFEPDRENDLRECVKTMPDVQLASLDFDSTEATFRYDVAKLMPTFNPKKPPTAEAVTKRFDELLRVASNGTFTLKPPATIPPGKMKVEEISAGILDCKGCRYAVYLAVAKLDGVEHATVGPTGLLKVWTDPAKVDRAALEAALKKGKIEFVPAH